MVSSSLLYFCRTEEKWLHRTFPPKTIYISYTLCLNMVDVELKEWGNSVGVLIPSETLKELGLHKGDTIEIDIVAKKSRDGFGICKGAKPFEEEKEELI